MFLNNQLGFSGNLALEIYVLYCHLYVALIEPNKYLLLSVQLV